MWVCGCMVCMLIHACTFCRCRTQLKESLFIDVFIQDIFEKKDPDDSRSCITLSSKKVLSVFTLCFFHKMISKSTVTYEILKMLYCRVKTHCLGYFVTMVFPCKQT